jgi:hypothetical protein
MVDVEIFKKLSITIPMHMLSKKKFDNTMNVTKYHVATGFASRLIATSVPTASSPLYMTTVQPSPVVTYQN